MLDGPWHPQSSLYSLGLWKQATNRSQLVHGGLFLHLTSYCSMSIFIASWVSEPITLLACIGQKVLGFFVYKHVCLVFFFMVVLGLHCCTWTVVAASGGYSLVVSVLRLLIVVTFLVEHRLALWLLGSRVVAHGHSWSTAERWNPCLLNWQVVSLPSNHRGGPSKCFEIRI